MLHLNSSRYPRSLQKFARITADLFSVFFCFYHLTLWGAVLDFLMSREV